MSPVPIRSETQGAPDLVVSLFGIDRQDRLAGPLMVGTAVHYGELRLGFVSIPGAVYGQDWKYTVDVKYRFLVKIYYQASSDAPIVEGATPPLEGRIQGTVIRNSSGPLFSSLTNEQTAPASQVVPFRRGDQPMGIALRQPVLPVYGKQQPFYYTDYVNRGYFTAQIGTDADEPKQP
jgi:hypothetical protein